MTMACEIEPFDLSDANLLNCEDTIFSLSIKAPQPSLRSQLFQIADKAVHKWGMGS